MHKQFFLILMMLIPGRAALAASSMAGWIDDPGANTMSIHAYTTGPNTNVQLYRSTVTGAQIDVGGNLVYSGTYPGGINMPGQALDIYPALYDDVDKSSGVATSYCVIKGDNPLLWEFDSTIGNTPSTDRQTFLSSNNSTNKGVHFYTWLSTGIAGAYTDGRGFGDALAVFNPNSVPVTFDFFRGNGRGAGGTFWNKIYTQTIAADSIFMIGGSVDMRFAPTCTALPGNPYTYGTWSRGASSALSYDAGDYAVASRSGSLMVWKANIFSCDSTNEPNDNIAYGVDSSTGSKVGRTIYGVSGRYAVGEVLVTNMSGLATTYDIYRYVPSATFPVGGTYDRAFPTGTSASGAWVLQTGGQVLGAAWGTSAIHSYGVDPGQFLKVVSNQDVQVAFGNGFIQSEYGDGDYVEGTVNHEPLDLEFYVAENMAQSAPRNALAIMAPNAGTIVTIAATPARAGFPITLPATTTVYQALRQNLSDLFPTVYRITTNADNAHPVYVYYQSVGTGAFGGAMEKFFSCATPKTNQPLLVVNKLADKFVAAPGDLITYTINYVNAGSGIANGVKIYDTIPANTAYVSDTASPAGSWASGGGAAGSIRQWIPNPSGTAGQLGIGIFGSFQVTVQVLPLGTLSNGTHVINNTALITDATGNTNVSSPAITLNVNNPSGAWVSYSALDKAGGAYRQTYAHFYTLQAGTNVQLLNTTTSDTQIATSVHNVTTGALQHQRYSIASSDRNYYKVIANYPINWEIDTINASSSGAGRQMYAYSTDMKLKDRVFMTHLDADSTSAASLLSSNWGDSIYVINPSTTATVNALLYYSSDNGVTWTQVGGGIVGAQSIYRYGGVTSANEGDYMVVAIDGDVMVTKGTALSTEYVDNHPLCSAVADAGTGRKVATAPASFYAPAQDQPNGIAVTNVGAGNATYSIYRYNSTVSGTWPISGSNGTWTLVSGPTVIATNTNGYYTPLVQTMFRVDVTAGTIQVQSGGQMTKQSVGADGDSFEGIVNSGVDWLASGGVSTGGRDQRFWITQNVADRGRIDVIAPIAGTVLTRGFGAGAWAATQTDPAAWPASTGGVDRGYQAYPNTTGNYWVSSQDAAHPIYVIYQSYMLNAGTKAFAGIPLVLDVLLTPTPSRTVSPSPTRTNTPSPTPTPSRTNSPSPTATPSYTPSASPTATPTNTPSLTPSPTRTPTPSNTPSPTRTYTPTVTPSFTPTRTPSVTPTVTPTVTPSATQSVTFTITPSITPTATPSNSPTRSVTSTVTPTITQTVTPSFSPTQSVTRTVTPSATQTMTRSFSPTQTVTNTVTPTRTQSVTPSSSPTQSVTNTVTPTITQSVTPSFSPTQTVTNTVTPTRTPSATPSITPTASPTVTQSITWTASPTASPTATPTASPSATLTGTPTQSVTPTFTISPIASPTITLTATATPTHTPSPTGTATITGTLTATQTPTVTPTASPTGTATTTGTSTGTQTPSASPSVTPSASPTATPSVTQSITWTASPTASPTATPTATPSATRTATPTQSVTPTFTDSPIASATITPTVTPSSTITPTPVYTVVSTQCFSVIAQPSVPNYPRYAEAVEYPATGDIYMVPETGDVVRLDPSFAPIAQYSTADNIMRTIAIYQDRLFVGGFGGQLYEYRILAGGALSPLVQSACCFGFIQGLEIDPANGRIYMVDMTASRVYELNLADLSLITTLGAGILVNGFSSFAALDPGAQELYVNDGVSPAMMRVLSTAPGTYGMLLRSFSMPGAGERPGMTWDQAGQRLFVSNFSANEVDVYDKVGNPLATITGISQPTKNRLISGGRLLVGSWNTDTLSVIVDIPCPSTPTPTSTATRTSTATPSATRTATASTTPSVTPSATLTATPTATQTAFVSPTPSPTVTETPTISPTPSISPTSAPYKQQRLILVKGVYPNPFSNKAHIYYTLRVDAYVRLTIYNVAGEYIRTEEAAGALGKNLLVWEGINSDGSRCASGVYILHFKAKGSDNVEEDFWETAVVAR